MRLLSFGDPWSGLAQDFHSHFGTSAAGQYSTQFASDGLARTRGMPTHWVIELADGTVEADYYSHHPPLFLYLEALSIRLFGVHEWALKLVPMVFSLFALLSMWRLFSMLWGHRVAWVASAMMAVVPFAAWYGVLPWTESAVTWAGLEATRCYLLWMRNGRRAHIIGAASWILLAGLFDWTGGFVLLGIGIHGLLYRTHGWRGLQSLLLLPLGFCLAALFHWLHMNYALPPGAASSETGSTLQAVTSLTTGLGHFLFLQASYAWRFLGPVIAPLFVLGLAHCAWLASRSRLNHEDSLALVLLLPGLLYVGLFPQRSINHDFFLMIGLPGMLALCTSAGFALMKRLPERSSLRIGALGLTLVLVVTSIATIQIWRNQRSDQIEYLVNAPRLAPILANDQAILLTPIGRGMCLPFYSEAQVIQHCDTTTFFEARFEGIIRRTPADRPAYVFFDVASTVQIESQVVAGLLGGPPSSSPRENTARVQALFDAMPTAQHTAIVSSVLFDIHVPLYEHLRQRFHSEFVAVEGFGAYELFDLRRLR